jgi:hypothetical protein
MNVGMLWLDADAKRGVLDRIGQAAAHYAKKYGRPATLCLLHPATAGEGLPDDLAGLKLRTNSKVLREHFWIGVEDSPAG